MTEYLEKAVCPGVVNKTDVPSAASDTPLEKVTAFVTRDTEEQREVLVFEHPVGVVQIPAGTVEAGELVEEAARREAREETGLASLMLRSYLGQQPQPMWRPDYHVVLRRATVRQRPAPDAPEAVPAFVYHGLRRGLYVRQVGTSESGYVPVAYEEFDGPAHLANEPSRRLFGWVEADALSAHIVRHFFHFTADDAPENWTQSAEEWGLPFALFWLPILGERSAVTRLVPMQAAWLADFREHLLTWDSSP